MNDPVPRHSVEFFVTAMALTVLGGRGARPVVRRCCVISQLDLMVEAAAAPRPADNVVTTTVMVTKARGR